MDRINSDNIGYDAQGRRIFKDGPPATTINDQWCNGVQEELMAVIESEGFAGSVSDNTLLLKSITAAIARATDNYVTVHDLGTKNILSANSGFDLDLYISGGLLAKPTGWRCRIAASNGLGASFFNCSPSTVYTINGISALNYRMYGRGNMTIELDNASSNWKIIDDADHIFDVWSTTVGGIAFEYRKRIKNEMILKIADSNLRTTSNANGSCFNISVIYTLPVAFSATPRRISQSEVYSSDMTWTIMAVYPSLSQIQQYFAGPIATAKGYFTMEYSGAWR
jgi:hypothetical protein